MSSLRVTDPRAPSALADALIGERPRLVRLCLRMTGSVDAAEDLAQETLLEAWRLLDRLTDPAGIGAWVAAIARNLCLRWLRANVRERAQFTLIHTDAENTEPSSAEALAAEVEDPLAELERAEVAALFTRALATLPETTRAMTLRSAEMSTSELAQVFDLTEGAVRVRLHRGRRALLAALSGPLRAEAEALDLMLPAQSDWLETRIWCPFCGSDHLRYQIDRASGEFSFRCARNCGGMAVAGRACNRQLLEQTRSPKSLVTRHCLALATSYREALAGTPQTCGCGAHISYHTRISSDLTHPTPYGILAICPNCGAVDDSTAWHLALDTVEAQRFWRRHPRMRATPMSAVERDNRLAVVTGFEATDGAERLEIVADAHTYALLHIATSAPR